VIDNDHPTHILLIGNRTITSQIQLLIADENDISLNSCEIDNLTYQMNNAPMPTIILLVLDEYNFSYDLITIIRDNSYHKDIPIVILSAKDIPWERTRSFKLGANDFMIMFPEKAEFLSRIRYHSGAYSRLLEKRDDLQRAERYIKSILPVYLERDKGISTEWILIPCVELSGDCLGYCWLDDNNFSFFLMDVCGHGLRSCFLALTILNVIRAQTLPRVSFLAPEQVLSALNKGFPAKDHDDMHFTIWYGVYNRQNHTLKYSNAGHSSFPLLFEHTSKRMVSLNECDPPIGLLDTEYSCHCKTIENPTSIYLFSDSYDRIASTDDVHAFIASKLDTGNELDLLYGYLLQLSGEKGLEDDFTCLKLTISND
jgi:phosphoserine phosphatase RsbU/P